MNTRTLVKDDGLTRFYEVRDAQGVLIGTDTEVIATAADLNLATLQAQAVAAMAQNRTAIAAPTGSVTLAQAVGQIKALSAQNNALIRIVLGLLDGTN